MVTCRYQKMYYMFTRHFCMPRYFLHSQAFAVGVNTILQLQIFRFTTRQPLFNVRSKYFGHAATCYPHWFLWSVNPKIQNIRYFEIPDSKCYTQVILFVLKNIAEQHVVTATILHNKLYLSVNPFPLMIDVCIGPRPMRWAE